MKYGYLYQGQRYKWQKKPRGTPGLDMNPAAFVTFIQNHDQIANSAYGQRCDSSHVAGQAARHHCPDAACAGTPMLFQGQEFGAIQPVPLFRRSQPAVRSTNSPRAARSFWRNSAAWRRQKCGALRRSLPIPLLLSAASWIIPSARRIATIYASASRFAAAAPRRAGISARSDGMAWTAPCSRPKPLCCDFLAMLGTTGCCSSISAIDLHLDPAPEPLLAPPADAGWIILWSSEDPKYGGTGTAAPDT